MGDKSVDDSDQPIVLDPEKYMTKEVHELLCVERIQRLETNIDGSMNTIVLNITHLTGRIEEIIEMHKTVVENHDDMLRQYGEDMAAMVQWKDNGERNKDLSFKRFTLLIGIPAASMASVWIFLNFDKVMELLRKVFK